MSILRRAVSVVRWLVKLEVGIWRSLFLLVTRQVPGRRPGVHAFSYSQQVVPIMGAFIFVSLIELPVVHLLLPWATVRVVALILGSWGLLWMVGFLASMKVFPHLLDAAGLRIRYGASADIRIPQEAIASVTGRRRSVDSRRSVHVERGTDETVLDIAVVKQTNVDVVLNRPTAVALLDSTEELTEARLYVDDPRAFVAAVRARLAG